MKLSIHNISKTYENGVEALKDVNLEIGNGMFGLLGPNGAGKSTLMRTIATLQESDSGEITFDGFNIHKEPEAIRRALSGVFCSFYRVSVLFFPIAYDNFL